MKKDPLVFVEHILQQINDVKEFAKGLSRENLEKDIKTQKAIVRSIEIMGEAVRNLSKKFREEHPEVEWKKMVGMRDMIVHEYFELNLGYVWDVIRKDLPVLKKQVEKILEEG